MILTNIHNLPLSLAVFLASDDYDGSKEEKHISATTLLKGVKQIIMSSRVSSEGLMTDISSLVSARMGNAYHEAIERSWKSDKLKEVLQTLGVPKRIREALRINPEEVTEDIIPVYLEQRAFKEVNGWTVNGKFDFIFNGIIEDFKSTSVHTYRNQNNADKYIKQGSIYRWLNPDKITSDHIQINYIFTDWSAHQAKGGKDYPPLRLLSQKYNLMSMGETDTWIKSKLRQLDKYWDKPEDELPPCTDEDLWRNETVWKYYGSEDAQRSSKNFDNPHDAALYMRTKKKGVVREVKGEARACYYCPAFTVCKQREEMSLRGEIK